jgi:hypothetical protein
MMMLCFLDRLSRRRRPPKSCGHAHQQQQPLIREH